MISVITIGLNENLFHVEHLKKDRKLKKIKGGG